ncbi:MAG: EamA family transporter [Rhodospirillaceae bacterium]|nr:MAG: EamA family transporter [Rhodospirillaceae bacterium]
MKSLFLTWLPWALLSAGFAGLTAIFAKVGVENISSDFATFLRTIVVLAVLTLILAATGQWQSLGAVSGRSYLFLTLSGLATGGSWLCYFRALKLGDAAKVAPVDKLSVILVALFATVFLGEKLSGSNWLGILLVAVGTILVAYRG